MLRYALIFLILALVASVLGFGGIAGDAAWIARVLLIIFVVMFLVSLVMGRTSTVAPNRRCARSPAACGLARQSPTFGHPKT